MKKCVCLLSGGPDSSTLAYYLKKEGYEVHTITFDFSSKEGKVESDKSKKISDIIAASHKIVDLKKSLENIYDIQGTNGIDFFLDNGGYSPIKPAGRIIELSLAASYSMEIGCSEIFYGVHKDDAIDKDNKIEFLSFLSKAISIETGKPFSIEVPFLNKTKSEIVALGKTLDVPFEDTWSCTANNNEYFNGRTHCGKCDSCIHRKEAFESNNLSDPVSYSN